MTTDHSNPSKPRRRWFQYSLRTLLVLVTVLCVFCVWLGLVSERARKQREAVAAIEAMGGVVYYDYQVDSSGTLLPKGILTYLAVA